MFLELLAHPQEGCTNGTWYTACVLCQLAAPGLEYLLRIKGLYMFRALLAHPQEALHKRHLVYCLRVMSVGCTRVNHGAAN
jgi:hypothetical protein